VARLRDQLAAQHLRAVCVSRLMRDAARPV
jgi:hypothetical protein